MPEMCTYSTHTDRITVTADSVLLLLERVIFSEPHAWPWYSAAQKMHEVKHMLAQKHQQTHALFTLAQDVQITYHDLPYTCCACLSSSALKMRKLWQKLIHLRRPSKICVCVLLNWKLVQLPGVCTYMYRAGTCVSEGVWGLGFDEVCCAAVSIQLHVLSAGWRSRSCEVSQAG